jgi:hypothetical protein
MKSRIKQKRATTRGSISKSGGKRATVAMPRKHPIRLVIATPAYGELFYAPFVRSLVSLTRFLNKENISFAFESISYAEVSEARNFLLTRFFDKSDATHLLFIDNDMGFPTQLIADMLSLKKPIVGVVSPKRQVDIERIIEAVKQGESDKAAIAAGHEFILRPLPGRNHTVENWFLPVEGCGAGIMLIERSCVEGMIKNLPDIIDTKTTSALTKNLDRMIRGFDALQIEGRRLSEDYSFCYRWRHYCDGEIWVNIGHEITHVGLRHFKARFADRIVQAPAKGKSPSKEKGANKDRPVKQTIQLPDGIRQKAKIIVRTKEEV